MNTIKQLRYIGIVEGVSSLLLFFIAMPLKYFNDMPEAVTLMGSIHGGLFVLYGFSAAWAYFRLKRPFLWGFKVFIAAVFPFGPFVIEPGLRREQDELEAALAKSAGA